MIRDQFLARIRNILLDPRTEWPVAAAENDSVGGLFRRYVLVLAAVPALAQFFKDTVIGYPLLGFQMRTSLHAGLLSLALGYAVSLILVLVAARLVNALAPAFGARSDKVQSMKAVAYASTAAWLAGAAMILPWLGWLVGIGGAIYSIYLLYVGLPHVMHCSEERSASYTAVIVAVTMVLWAVAGTLLSGLIGSADVLHSAVSPQLSEAATGIAQSATL